MADTTTAPDNSNTTSSSFLTGVTEGFFSVLGTALGNKITGQAQAGTATPGATGSGTSAAATGTPAATGMSANVKYTLIAAGAALAIILGIVLIKKKR